jgi:hypothetical protein
MLHTKFKQPMLVSTERLSETGMGKQGGDGRIDARLVGSEWLDYDAQRRMLIPATLVAVAGRRATAGPIRVLAASNLRTVAHHNLLEVQENERTVSPCARPMPFRYEPVDIDATAHLWQLLVG